MGMSNNIKYKYTCKYCGTQWELTYQVKYPKCYSCKDENVKCEEIKIKDYYGNKDNSNEIDHDKIYWRD